MILRLKCEVEGCTGTIEFRQRRGPDKPVTGDCAACGGWFRLSAGDISRLPEPVGDLRR